MSWELIAISPVLYVTGLMESIVKSNDLIEQLKITQVDNKKLPNFMEKSLTSRFRGRLCIPKDEVLRKSILFEAHRSKFFNHLRMKKTYQDMKRTH